MHGFNKSRDMKGLKCHLKIRVGRFLCEELFTPGQLSSPLTFPAPEGDGLLLQRLEDFPSEAPDAPRSWVLELLEQERR